MTSIKAGSDGTAGPAAGQPVMAGLSRLDRFLPVWIGAAMAAGLLLGRLVPGLNSALNKVAIHGTSLPIALGLLRSRSCERLHVAQHGPYPGACQDRVTQDHYRVRPGPATFASLVRLQDGPD